MNVFKAVKENVAPMDAARRYGLKVNRRGMCACPFHNDRNPSMKIDSRIGGGFHCFGCQESGDVIDLVAKLYGTDKREAAVRIAHDFQIPCDSNWREGFVRASDRETEANRKKQESLNFAIRKRDLSNLLLALTSEMRKEKHLSEERAMEALKDDAAYQWILNEMDRVEDDYEWLIDHSDEEVRIVIDEMEREVLTRVREFKEIRDGSKRSS